MAFPEAKWVGYIFFVLAVVVLIFGIEVNGRRLRFIGVRWFTRVDASVLVMIISALVFCAALGNFVVTRTLRASSPLKIYVGDEPSFALSGTTHVTSLNLGGINQSSDPIAISEAIVRSDIDNSRIPFKFLQGSQFLDVDAHVVMPGIHFNLIAKTAPNDPLGMPIEEFRARFGRFTYIIRYDDKVFTKHFSAERIKAVLDNATRSREPLGPGPAIAPKR